MILLVNQQNRTNNLAGFDTVSVQGQTSDPISKAYFMLYDAGSLIKLANRQEVVICDETIQLAPAGSIVPLAPWSDSFTPYTGSNYTSTFNPTGGSASTWTGGSGTLTASGGVFALLLKNSWSAKDIDISCTVTTSDAGGLSFRVQDSSNFYELAARDGSSPSPNVLQLFKTVAGTRNSVGAGATIAWTRGTSHTVRVTMTGTAITVYFDGVSKISLTDSSLAGPGQVGLRNDNISGSTSSIYTSFSATSNDAGVFTAAAAVPSIPSHNYLLNNNFNLGVGYWTTGGPGLTFPSNPTYGAGALCTLAFANTAVGTTYVYQNASTVYGIPGQKYCFSGTLNITQAFTNSNFYIQITFIDGNGSQLAAPQQTYTGISNSRVSITATAPANTVTVQANFGGVTTNATNSGTATFTALQLEPVWFAGTIDNNGYTTNYPTPICDNLQPDCTTVVDGTAVRYNRIFAGFIANPTTTSDGVNRTWDVECSSLAGYLETDTLINASYTNTQDITIITSAIAGCAHLTTKAQSTLHTNGPDFASANAMVLIPGQVVPAVNYNDATARDVLNGVSNLSGYLFGVDNYGNVFYQPATYQKAPYAFSSNPDFSSTFSVYDYKYNPDGTQIRNVIRVSGSTYQATTTEAWVIQDGSHTEFINTGQTYDFVPFHAPTQAPTSLVIGGTTYPVHLNTGGSIGSPEGLYNPGYPDVQINPRANAGAAISMTYVYTALNSVEVWDAASVKQYGKCYHPIHDTGLTSLAACQQRGENEVLQYAQPRATLAFKTQVMLQPGQSITFTSANDNLSNTKFTVQSVGITWLGNGKIAYACQCGPYSPDFIDYVRNIQKATNRGKVQAGAPIQTYVAAATGDSITFTDSINIH